MPVSKIPGAGISGGSVTVSQTAPDNSLVITSGGDVCIGTTSGTQALNIYRGAGQNSIIEMSGNATTIGTTSFAIGQGGDSFAYIYQRSNAPMLFATNNTERMRINSSGIITMPNKPIFMGYPTTDYSSGGMPTGIIGFAANYNNGSYFNPANSRFTAPVTGWYRTTWGGLQLAVTVTSLMVNGVRLFNGNHFPSNVSYITMTQTVIVYLNAGDYLNVEGWNGGGYFNTWYQWTVEQIG